MTSTRQNHHLLELILFFMLFVVLGTAVGAQVGDTDIQDPRGDVNMDSVPYTLADAVYFVEYLLGCIELTDPVYQDTASDVNLNTIPWEMADLVIIVRVINGLQKPPQTPPDTTDLDTIWVSTEEDSNQVKVVSSSGVPVGGAYFAYEPRELIVGTPKLTERSQEMDLQYSIVDGELRFLMFSWVNACILPGSGPLVTIPVTGTGHLILQEADLCDAEGNLLEIKILPSGTDSHESFTAIPNRFNLFQNYPNPFNPTTEIRYALPKDCNVRLEIYNVLAQKVATLVDGEQAAGYKVARWDAGKMSSGIYLYRLQVRGTPDSYGAGDYTETRRMILLKRTSPPTGWGI